MGSCYLGLNAALKKDRKMFEFYWANQFGTALGHFKLGLSYQIIIVLSNWKQISDVHE